MRNGWSVASGAAGLCNRTRPQPRRIDATAGDYSEFWYGPQRQRYKQISYNASPVTNETTVYVDGLFEKRSSNGATVYDFHIFAEGEAVSIGAWQSGNYFEFAGLHKDALDSIIVAAEVANPTLFQSFDAWGQRRDESLWTSSPPVAAALFPTIDRRGFTGHEHLDNLNLVHMNGRAYAPVIGRFLSADPFIPDLYNTQALNRYSYVYNNPLSYTDPSGFDREPPSWGSCRTCEPGSIGRFDALQPRRTFRGRPLRQGASVNSIAPSGMPSDFVQGAMGLESGGPICHQCKREPLPEPPLESLFCVGVIQFLCMASGQDAPDLGLPAPKGKAIRQTIVSTERRTANGAAEAAKLTRDATGKIHGRPLPKIEDLKKAPIEKVNESIAELKASIMARKQELERLGEHGSHRARIAEEERLLRSLEKHVEDQLDANRGT